jgi:ribonuclease HI
MQPTTKNQTEFTAATQGLRALNESCAIDLKTDSQHVRQGFSAFPGGWNINEAGFQWDARSKSGL